MLLLADSSWNWTRNIRPFHIHRSTFLSITLIRNHQLLCWTWRADGGSYRVGTYSFVMTNSPVFIIVHFFFPVCVCCCLGDSRIAARPTLSIGESDWIRQNVGVAASGSRYGSLSFFVYKLRVSCSEITGTAARDSSRCSPLAIFCSLSFFFPPVCPAKRRRVSGRREHLFSANVSAGLYWRLVRGLLGCVTFIKRRPRRLGS